MTTNTAIKQIREDVLNEAQIGLVVSLIREILSEEDYGTIVSELEDQVLSLSTALHDLKQEVEQIWEELE